MVSDRLDVPYKRKIAQLVLGRLPFEVTPTIDTNELGPRRSCVDCGAVRSEVGYPERQLGWIWHASVQLSPGSLTNQLTLTTVGVYASGSSIF